MIYIVKIEVQRLDSPGDNPMHNDRKVYDLGEITLRGEELEDVKRRAESALNLVEDWR